MLEDEMRLNPFAPILEHLKITIDEACPVRNCIAEYSRHFATHSKQS